MIDYYKRDLGFDKIYYKRRAWQFDPKRNKQVLMTFYLRSKQGKLSDKDQIFIIGILNEETGNYEEFALTEDEPLGIIEHIFTNDYRLESQIRSMKKLRLLEAKLFRLHEQKTGKKLLL